VEFTYQYKGQSQIIDNVGQVDVCFSPDTLRKPTFFSGALKQGLIFREAISALHQVVISDMRFKPKDKSEYERWLSEMETSMLLDFMKGKSEIEEKYKNLQQEWNQLNRKSASLLKPYYKAQFNYFNYLYQHDMDAWLILDPVISIHPDEVFFECFSDDESSYGKLSCHYNVFEKISDKEYGTTNIDYSQGLYDQFQKIRDYKTTQLVIDPDGFKIKTSDEKAFEEKKIDLPDSWVRGFLQVSSAMTMPMIAFDLSAMDIHNICFLLRRHKERVGPRSMRFILKPGEPIRILFDPWDYTLICKRSIFKGHYSKTIRVWGRRRIHILERLIPHAKKFTLYLMGDGMPSFYIADLGDLSFTLGLSGWSANDWSRMGNFDLMAPRGDIDDISARHVYKTLQTQWVANSVTLARQTGYDESLIKTAMAKYAQQGLVLYDLTQNLYRIRALTQTPLPISKLRFSNGREAQAQTFITQNKVSLETPETVEKNTHLRGLVTEGSVDYHPELSIDHDYRIHSAICQCHFYHQNKMRQGPCEHMIALRLSFNSKRLLS
jgi:hypothetical protein